MEDVIPSGGDCDASEPKEALNNSTMKRSDQTNGFNAHNYVTVIPVEYPRSDCPSVPGTVRSWEDREPPAFRSSPLSRRPLHSISHQITPPVRPPPPCYPSSGRDDDKRRMEADRATHQLRPRQDVCIFLMNKVGLCVDAENGSQTTAQDLLDLILQDDHDVALPYEAKDVFALWMTSPHLELQLKPQHRPHGIRQRWPDLLVKYTSCSPLLIEKDDPILSFQRNVFFDKKEEMKIVDMKILELLYEEAKWNVLDGRYPLETKDCEILAAIQSRLEFGAFNAEIHTPDFFRNRLRECFPEYICKTSLSWFGYGSKNRPEFQVVDHYRNIPPTTTTYKLLRKYLEFCWNLPFYGSAFFHGQVEQVVKGIAALIDHHDRPVMVAINREGVYILYKEEPTMLLSLKYQEFSWDYACPSQPQNPDCLPCLFLQFKLPGQNQRETKVMQVFSKQAALMDTLISAFVSDLRKRPSWSGDETEHGALACSSSGECDFGTPMRPAKSAEAQLINKLKRVSLATFSDTGECVKPAGSWSFFK